jgi:DNA (cytosine-5)-methyltransferase 1
MIKGHKNSNKEINLLSLFSGCGGMDLGFEGDFEVLRSSINSNIHPQWIRKDNEKHDWIRLPRTRFKTVFANDISQAAKAAWVPFFDKREKNKGVFHKKSIVDLVKEHKQGTLKIPKVDIVTGGFPCQDFSVAGKRKGFNSHKGHHGALLKEFDNATEENRGKLYMWMKDVVEIAKPKVFIAENVKGLVSLKDAKEIIANDFRKTDSGYIVVDPQVLYAPHFGVPQSRERVFFIGFRVEDLTEIAREELTKQSIIEKFNPYPVETHGERLSISFNNFKLNPIVTAGEYLLDLDEPNLAQDMAQRSYSKAKWYGKHCQGQSEISLQSVGPTIRSEHHGNIEFRRLSLEHGGSNKEEIRKGLSERRLTVRECARLQTFPDNFEFVREAEILGKEFKLSASDGYRLVGNAVPPLLAFHIAWRLQELWPLIFKK